VVDGGKPGVDSRDEGKYTGRTVFLLVLAFKLNLLVNTRLPAIDIIGSFLQQTRNTALDRVSVTDRSPTRTGFRRLRWPLRLHAARLAAPVRS